MEGRRQQSVYILYGSQTGNGESIAQEMVNMATSKGIPVICDKLNNFNKLDPPLEQASICVIICSTTGNGDSPENAEKFWRFIKRRTQPKDLFAGLRYTVLGLGDTNYDKFCHMGKSINTRLADLGATRFYDMVCGDEATGLEDTIDPWIENLWPVLHKEWFGEPANNGQDNGTVSTTGAEDEDMSCSKAEEKDNCGTKFCLPANLTTIQTHAAKLGIDVTSEPNAADVPRLRASHATIERIDTGKEVATRNACDSEWTAENPYDASIVSARYLTAGSSSASRRVIHMELDLGGSNMTYEPGDSIGILCPNSEFDCHVVLDRLSEHHGLPADAVVLARGTSCAPTAPCAVEELVRYKLDLHSSPRKPLLRTLAEYCKDPVDRNQLLWLCSKKEKELNAFIVERQQLTLGELLYMLPSCAPPLEVLMSICPPMPPRYYSIASSPLVDRNRVSVAFSVVHYNLHPSHAATAEEEEDGDAESVDPSAIHRNGLCTTWLERLCAPWLLNTGEAQMCVRTFMKPTKEFRLPGSLKWPLILIGPGTGVAPFIGFLSHRAAQSKAQEALADEVCCGYWRGGYEVEMKGEESAIDEFRCREGRGPAWLFFGCRHPEQDWIYKSDMEEHLSSGLLTALQTAFSRLQKEKQYVQGLMRENAEELYRLINQEGGYIYVCGDGNRMAKDVHNCLKTILMESGNMEDEDAEEYLSDLKQHARYLLDIWS